MEKKCWCYACLQPLDSDRRAKCDACGAELDASAVEQLCDLARDSVLYGYVYPIVEQRDRDAGRNVRHKLELEPIMVWLGLAALAGVIGGASYDLVKAAMRKILGAGESGRKVNAVSSVGRTYTETKNVVIGTRREEPIELTDDQLEVLIEGVKESAPQWLDPVIVGRKKAQMIANLERYADASIPAMEALLEANGIDKKVDREDYIKRTLEGINRDYRAIELPDAAVEALRCAVEDDDIGGPT